MFIERIDVERFGALSRVVIDRLGPGVQVLHGTNETGKTTLLEFVRAVFFGFEGLFRRGVLDPRIPCAGQLIVRSGPERALVAVERRHEGPQLATLTQASYLDDVVGLGGDHGDLIEITELETGDAAAAPRNRVYLQDLVGDIDETTFTNVMAFGLDELHELRTLEPEGCGSRLYELASGLDRSKVARVLTHLREAITRLDSADPAVSPLAALETRRQDLLERLAGHAAPALTAGGLWAELAHLDGEIKTLDVRVAQALHAEGVIRGVIALEPLHVEWRRTAAAVAALEAAPLVHADRDAWRTAMRRLRRAERLAAVRKKKRSHYARALRDLPTESVVWAKRVAVRTLCEEQPRLERLVADVARAEAHARLAARRFGEQVGAAGLSRVVPIATAVDLALESLPEVLLPEGFSHSFGPLRSRARDRSRAARRVKEAKRALAATRRTLVDTRGSVTGAAQGLAGLSIADAIAQAGERLGTLRRRLTTGEQLGELERTVGRLEREVGDSLTGQLIPVPWLVGLGALFVIGAGMLLSGLLLPQSVTGSLAYAIAALGLAGTGVASVTTWSLDRNATTRLEAARRQLALARKQREETATQLGLLDRTIGPDSVTTLERRLLTAQQELDRLEELAAREGSVHALGDRVALAEQALQQALEEQKLARGRWRKALEHRGLPPTLTPREVRQIAAHRHTLLTLDDDRRRLSEEARTKREEVAAFAKRVDELLVECDLLPESTPLDHLQLLQERLDADKTIVRRRATYQRRLETARRRHRQALRQVKVGRRGVEEFYARWHVTTEQAFLAKVDRRPEYEDARRAAANAEAAWFDARRRTTEPADVDLWLTETATVPLATRLAEATAATARQRAALAAATDRRTAVAARVAAAAGDRCTESLQVELADVEERIGQQLDRRRVLERARLLLEETRAAVARDHQPPVLREASRWLARLTEGRYTQITTAIDEARLEVHENDGNVWNPERLSRGTREQVFLALRLALIRDLNRHDVSLPVVMDDALVNFDDARAHLAARVLVEFVAEQSADRQMLVLTCHEHVARIFHEAGAHVRSLSDAKPLWARTPPPPPVIVAPVVRPAPPPPPVRVETRSDLWPAEEFFFGRGAVARR
jgi:recombinational DNA repair ATPase RecF